jgi:hypothetical protein
MNDALGATNVGWTALRILSLIPTASRPVNVALAKTQSFNQSNAQNLDGAWVPVDLDARPDGQSEITAALDSVADRES